VPADYVTVSAKILKRLKELLERYNIKPGPMIRRALEDEAKRRAEPARGAEGRLKEVRKGLGGLILQRAAKVEKCLRQYSTTRTEN